MNPEQRNKLLTLASFLETLPEEKFRFDQTVAVWDYDNHCGSVCCAIGWTPKLFPDEVSWSAGEWATTGFILAGDDEDDLSSFGTVAAKIFGLPRDLAELLFCPTRAEYVHSSLPWLNKRAKPAEVAAMMRQFLELVDKGKINL